MKTLRHLVSVLSLTILLTGNAHALGKVWGDSYDGFDSAGNTTNNSVDATGYEYALAYACDDDVTSNTITFTDSVSSTDITYYPQQTSGTITGRLALIKLASSGTGYTVSAAHSGTPTFRNVGFWLIDSTTGLVTADDADGSFGTGTGTAVDAGTLNNSGASAVSFMAVCIGSASTGNTQGTDWTEDRDTNENFGIMNIAESRGPETTTTINPDYTLASSNDWAALSASYRESSASGPVGTGLIQSKTLQPLRIVR